MSDDDPWGDANVITASSTKEITVQSPTKSMPLRPRLLAPPAPTVPAPVLVVGCHTVVTPDVPAGFLMARWGSGVINLYESLHIRPERSSAHMTAIDEAASRFFLAENGATRPQVTMFDYNSSAGRPIHVELPSPAEALAIDDTGNLWILCPQVGQESGCVVVYDHKSEVEIARHGVPAGSADLVFDSRGNSLWICGSTTMVKLDASNGTQYYSLAQPGPAKRLLYDSVNRLLYMRCDITDTAGQQTDTRGPAVIVFNENGEQQSVVSVPVEADWLCAQPCGNVWFGGRCCAKIVSNQVEDKTGSKGWVAHAEEAECFGIDELGNLWSLQDGKLEQMCSQGCVHSSYNLPLNTVWCAVEVASPTCSPEQEPAPGDEPLEFIDGVWVPRKTGYCEKTWRSGAEYKGWWKQGLFDGFGILTNSDGSGYAGMWKCGEPHGHGRQVLSNGLWYCGCFQSGIRKDTTNTAVSTFSGDVEGMEQPPQGIFKGEWKAGQLCGQGSCEFVNGDSYAGSWVEGQLHGEGKYLWLDGDSYSGQFKSNQLEGRGTFQGAGARKYSYTGIFRNGKFRQRTAKTFIEQRALAANSSSAPLSPVRGMLTDFLSCSVADVRISMLPVVLNGPGRGALAKMLFDGYPDLFGQAVRHTTCADHSNTDGFAGVSEDEMVRMEAKSSFVELEQVAGGMHGTSKEAVHRVAQDGKICLLATRMEASNAIRRTDMNARFIFVAASQDTCLAARTHESPEEIRESWAEEMAYSRKLGFHHLVCKDEDPATAFDKIREYLRLGPPKQRSIKDEIRENVERRAAQNEAAAIAPRSMPDEIRENVERRAAQNGGEQDHQNEDVASMRVEIKANVQKRATANAPTMEVAAPTEGKEPAEDAKEAPTTQAATVATEETPPPALQLTRSNSSLTPPPGAVLQLTRSNSSLTPPPGAVLQLTRSNSSLTPPPGAATPAFQLTRSNSSLGPEPEAATVAGEETPPPVLQLTRSNSTLMA